MDIDEFLDGELKNNKGTKRGATEATNKSSNSFGVGNSETELFKQINSVKEMIHNNHNLEGVNRMFFSLKDKYVAIAKKQKQENRYIIQELETMNKEIVQLLHNEKEKLNIKILSIMDLLKKAQMFLANKQINQANNTYIEIKELIKQIPDIFIEKKRTVQNQALQFYIQLTEEVNKISFISLKKRINEITIMIKAVYKEILNNNRDQLEPLYKKINIEYSRLPEGYADEKIRIYGEILHLFKCIYLGAPVPEQYQNVNREAPVAINTPKEGMPEPLKMNIPPK